MIDIQDSSFWFQVTGFKFLSFDFLHLSVSPFVKCWCVGAYG